MADPRGITEQLEPRRLLAAVGWDFGGDGTSWSDPLNWTTNTVPGPGDDVTLNVPNTASIVIDSSQSIRSLVSEENITINNATLTVATTADINGLLRLNGATLAGGSYDVLGGTLEAGATQSTLASVQITGDVRLNQPNSTVLLTGTTRFTNARLSGASSALRFAPGFVLNDTVRGEGPATGTRTVTLAGAGTYTIAGAGRILLDAGAGAGLNVLETAATTLVNDGQIRSAASGQILGIGTTSFTNEGTLGVSNGVLAVNAANWSNADRIEVSGGFLNLGGTFNATGPNGIGTFNRTGGTVNVTGTLVNTGSTLPLDANTGSFNLGGGTILNGFVKPQAGNNLVFTTGGGTLDNTVIDGDLVMNQPGGTVLLTGGSRFNTARMTAASTNLRLATGYTLQDDVHVEGAEVGGRTLTLGVGGPGNVTFTSAAIVRVMIGAGGGLTIGQAGAVTLLNGGDIRNDAADRSIAINTSALTNTGFLTATAGTLSVNAANWTNPGQVTVGAATVNLGGTLNASAGNVLGTFNRTSPAGVVNVTGTIDNTGSTLVLDSGTGSFRLAGGTLLNAFVKFAGGSTLVPTSLGGTLNNTTIDGDLLFNTTDAEITLVGNSRFVTARLAAGGAELKMAAGFTLQDDVTVEGGAAGNRLLTLAHDAAGTVTFTSAVDVRVVTGAGGGLVIDDPGSAASFISNGRLTLEAEGRTTSVSTQSFTNAGTLAVSAGIASITAGTWNSTGTLHVFGTGILNIGGTFSTAGGQGTFIRSGGIINVVGQISNTLRTLTLDASTGSFRLVGGTITGGTVNSIGGNTLFATSAGGTLDGIILNGDLRLADAQALARVQNGTRFTAARLSGGNSVLELPAGYTLRDQVLAEGSATEPRHIRLMPGGGVVVFASTASVRLAAGSGGGLNIDQEGMRSLHNSGLISAEATGRTLTIATSELLNNGTLAVTTGSLVVSSSSWRNAGTISVSGGGTLVLGGGLDATSGIGTFSRSGGTVTLQGQINNAGNALALNATTGSWLLDGGAITGGSLTFSGGSSLRPTVVGGTLTDVAVTGDIVLDTPNAFLRVGGSTRFTAVRLASSLTELRLGVGYTLRDLVSAEGGVGGTRSVVYADGGTGTSTIASTGIVRIAANSGAGLAITGDAGDTLVNQGLITSDTASRTITIGGGSFQNAGTLSTAGGAIEVISTNWTSPGTIAIGGGTLTLGGTLSLAGGFGGITRSGGTVSLTGTLLGGSSTLDMASTGSIRLEGGTVSGGTVNPTATARLVFTPLGGRLQGVTYTGDLRVDTPNAVVRLGGSTRFAAARLATGDVTLEMAPGYTLRDLVIAEGSSFGTRRILIAAGGNGDATFASTATVQLAPGAGDNLVIDDLSTGRLFNQGLIVAEAVGRELRISTAGLTNSSTGTLNAAVGTLTVGVTPTNYSSNSRILSGGTWRAAGTLRLPGITIAIISARVTLDGPAALISDSLTANTSALAPLTTVTSSGVFTLRGGYDFSTNGALSLFGTLDLGRGSTVSVSGSYSSSSTSRLITQIGGADPDTGFGRVVATNIASINGRLTPSTVDGYDPVLGSSFPVVTGSPRSGTFSSVTPFATPSGRSLGAAYDATSARVVVEPIPFSTPDLAVGSDTGISNSDNVTRDNTPTITGLAENGATIRIFADGVQVGTGLSVGGVYSITTSPLTEGVRTITAQAFPLSGGGPINSPGSLQITIDRTSPTATITPAIGSLRNAALASIRFTTSEDVFGVAVTDFTLTRDGGSNLLGGTLEATSPTDYTLSGLSSLTSARGLYSFSGVSTGITDTAGNTITGLSATWRRVIAGDMNDDGVLNNQDIAPFVQALTDPVGYQAATGFAPNVIGDIDGNGTMNNQDISPFIALLTGGRPAGETAGTKAARGIPLSTRPLQLAADEETPALTGTRAAVAIFAA
jgi:hypothetical protein